jgi:hypothetical protein
MNKQAQIRQASQHVREVKLTHQRFQVRKPQPKLAASVVLERRLS